MSWRGSEGESAAVSDTVDGRPAVPDAARAASQAGELNVPFPASCYALYGKRIVDFSIAFLALPFLILTLLPVTLAIKLDDGGPVFYRQWRWGRGGRPFRMWKFRSMVVAAQDLRNADSSTMASKDDPRVTRVGRFLRQASIDELPQLLNVLAGDMSLVGPRPNLATKPVAEMGEQERRRLAVRPGITGYNQAYYRNTSTLAERYAADCHYVDHMSLALDLRVVGRTILTVAGRKGIFTEGQR
ncbi:MAG: sugar transferase [Propionibacteriaceae bacterium]|nr:sugar transferase [Propionibacteriaceae bacterium]